MNVGWFGLQGATVGSVGSATGFHIHGPVTTADPFLGNASVLHNIQNGDSLVGARFPVTRFPSTPMAPVKSQGPSPTSLRRRKLICSQANGTSIFTPDSIPVAKSGETLSSRACFLHHGRHWASWACLTPSPLILRRRFPAWGIHRPQNGDPLYGVSPFSFSDTIPVLRTDQLRGKMN